MLASFIDLPQPLPGSVAAHWAAATQRPAYARAQAAQHAAALAQGVSPRPSPLGFELRVQPRYPAYVKSPVPPRLPRDRLLDAARAFYGGVLGCREGRSTDTWVDFDFFGHQISLHLGELFKTTDTGQVGEHLVPMPHLGLILQQADWQAMADRLRAAGTAFVIEPQLRWPPPWASSGRCSSATRSAIRSRSRASKIWPRSTPEPCGSVARDRRPHPQLDAASRRSPLPQVQVAGRGRTMAAASPVAGS